MPRGFCTVCGKPCFKPAGKPQTCHEHSRINLKARHTYDEVAIVADYQVMGLWKLSRKHNVCQERLYEILFKHGVQIRTRTERRVDAAPIKTCPICGSSFKVKREHHLTCSKECWWQLNKQQNTEKRTQLLASISIDGMTRKEAVLHMWEKGVRMPTIGLHLGISRQRVLQILQKAEKWLK